MVSEVGLCSLDISSAIAQEKPSTNFSSNYEHLCEFAELDNMIRDKIVFSTENPALKERLLCEPRLSLEKAVDIS